MTSCTAVPSQEFCGEECPLVIVGAWQLSAGHSSAADAGDGLASLRAHVDAGLRCIDCADIYTGVEDLLGHLGQDFRVHTKCVPDLDALESGITRDYLEAGVVRSLNRLRRTRLDLVQLHWWDYSVPGFDAAFVLLHELAREGLIGAVGLTNTDLPHMRQLVATGHSIASNQVQFSLLDRRPERSGMVQFCREQGIELVCYGVLAGGFLTDKWLGVEDPGFDSLENRSLTKYRLIIDEYGAWEDFQRLLRLLRQVADARGSSISEVSSAWAHQKAGGRLLQGARGSSHVASMTSSLRRPLAPEHVALLDAEVGDKGLKGEVFEAERQGGRHTGIMRRNLNGIGGAAQVAECLARGAAPLRQREIDVLRRLGNDVSSLEA